MGSNLKNKGKKTDILAGLVCPLKKRWAKGEKSFQTSPLNNGRNFLKHNIFNEKGATYTRTVLYGIVSYTL
jgi:hypothetical protein